MNVFCPYDAAGHDRRAYIGLAGSLVPPVGTESAVDPSVFVAGEPDVIYIRFGRVNIRYVDGVVPERKIIDAVVAFRNGEERFPVCALYSCRHQIFILIPDRAGIEHAVYPEAL